MDSVLRPRDIQARIRAGETPEVVAAAAQTSVDKIRGFANPVLAERAYQAQLAQRASVRRRAATGHVGNLGAAVTSHLETLDVDPETVEWDSWRREDGRWTVVATYAAHGEQHRAEFTYDSAGRFVVADDDEARTLVGERATIAAESSQAGTDLRTQVAPADEAAPGDLLIPRDPEPGDADGTGEQLPLGDDAIDLVTGRRSEPGSAPVPPHDQVAAEVTDAPRSRDAEPQSEVTIDLTDTTTAVRSAAPGLGADADWISTQASERPARPEPDAPHPDGAPASEPWDTPGDDDTVEGDAREEEEQEAAEALFEAPESTPAPRPARTGRGRGRASVPSWDEIMFGTPKSE